MNKKIICGVAPGSIAEELGIEPGDILLSVNGEEIGDIFDYRLKMAEEAVVVGIEKKNGEVWSLDIEKDENEDIGLEFENPLMDEEKSCRNKCIFCFIDQLPPGMRETLYYKDDDARLSFLFGNYITLTNLSDDETGRIISHRLSPINVSVHTTNPALRVKMLNNRFAGNVLERIRRFTESGIEVNCQIVACPGVNDGEELDRTISDLSGLYPQMHSISVVPVGLTRYRDGLYPLRAYDKKSALKTVFQVEKWQGEFLERYGSRLVYLADEFYLMAGKDLPAYEEYEDFPQIENGVGMAAAFIREAEDAMDEIGATGDRHARTVSIATGTAFFPLMSSLAAKMEDRIEGLSITVHPVVNHFFGETVTVAGLLTGQDLIKGLTGKTLGDVLLVSRNMLRAGTETLLDDMTLSDISRRLGVPMEIIGSGGDLVRRLAGTKASSAEGGGESTGGIA